MEAAKNDALGQFQHVDITPVREIAQDVLTEVSRVIVGYGDILQNMFISLLVNGHIYLEGVPGLAKSVMAKTFAKVKKYPEAFKLQGIGGNHLVNLICIIITQNKN